MPDLQNVIIDLPIYGSFNFPLSEKDNAKEPRALSDEAKEQIIGLFQNKVYLKCVDCGKECPFDVSYSIVKYSRKDTVFEIKNYAFPTLIDGIRTYKSQTLLFPNEDEGIIHYVFRCTMEQDHYYTMDLLYRIQNGSIEIRKIGQKPLNTDLKESRSNEYKKILDIYDSFEDYRHYEQCASRNLLAGACTYLRRVLEKMVNNKLEALGVGKCTDVFDAKFEEKLKMVKDQFDEDVRDSIKNSWRLLSKGIHELNNDEIKDFYKLVVEVVNIQLQSEKEKKEREEKRTQLRNEINAISSKKESV